MWDDRYVNLFDHGSHHPINMHLIISHYISSIYRIMVIF